MVKFMVIILLFFCASAILAMALLLQSEGVRLQQPFAPPSEVHTSTVPPDPTSTAALPTAQPPTAVPPTTPPLFFPIPEASPQPTPVPSSPFTLMLRVVDDHLNVRAAPDLSSERLAKLPPGAYFSSDPTSAITADGYVWHYHNAGGWSALGPAAGTWDDAFVAPISPTASTHKELPGYGELFIAAPVSLSYVDWVQYFGDTNFARLYGEENNYAYASGLHGGLDFGLSTGSPPLGVPVFAATTGIVSRRLSNQIWLTIGPYEVGYVHLEDIPRGLQRGSSARPDTFLGNISRADNHLNNLHLHLEVIYLDRFLVNPVEMMPPLPWELFDFEGYAPDARYQDPASQPLIELSS